MAVSDGQTTAIEMKMRLREKPLSELMEEMEKLSSTPDYDVDLLCAYLDVLEEKAPVLPADYDPAAEYQKFRQSHSEFFDAPEPPAQERPAPKKGRFFRLRQVLTSFAAIFCLVILMAEASGAGVIDHLIEWGVETFSLHPASGVMELTSTDENGFRSLQDALDYYKVEEIAIPTWIPNRYTIDKVSIFESNDTITISGKYISVDNELFIRATISFEEAFTFEENKGDELTTYETNGISFILSTNLEKIRANWNVNGCAYSASGNVTESELKEMLDSIQIKE